MSATIPKGQINAPDQLDYMSTLRKIPVRLMKIDGVLMTPEVAKVVESLQEEIERLRTSLEMSQASPLSEEAMDIMKAENDKLNRQIWDSNDVKVAMAIKHTTEVNRLEEEVARLRKLKDYWAAIVHSERKEYNALQDSTRFDEATIANLKTEVEKLKETLRLSMEMLEVCERLLPVGYGLTRVKVLQVIAALKEGLK